MVALNEKTEKSTLKPLSLVEKMILTALRGNKNGLSVFELISTHPPKFENHSILDIKLALTSMMNSRLIGVKKREEIYYLPDKTSEKNEISEGEKSARPDSISCTISQTESAISQKTTISGVAMLFQKKTSTAILQKTKCILVVRDIGDSDSELVDKAKMHIKSHDALSSELKLFHLIAWNTSTPL